MVKMTDGMQRSLLVIAAHPDDETLGCGGLIARTVREGGRVSILILTEGSSAQYPDRPDLMETKEAQASEAAKRLGVEWIEFARLPDMALSTLSPSRLNEPVESAVRKTSPGWVAVHHDGDLNRDHALANEAARVATRPGTGVRSLIAYETLSSTAWGNGPFSPDLYIALDEADLEAKVDAFGVYHTEVRDFPHPRSPEAIRHLAASRGAEAGFRLAEAYRSIWHRL